MTDAEEKELLLLTRENNALLWTIVRLVLQIARLVLHDEGNDFIHNLIANLVANKMEGNTYALRY